MSYVLQSQLQRILADIVKLQAWYNSSEKREYYCLPDILYSPEMQNVVPAELVSSPSLQHLGMTLFYADPDQRIRLHTEFVGENSCLLYKVLNDLEFWEVLSIIAK